MYAIRSYYEHLALFISGQKERESWALPQSPSTFFQLKSYVENLLLKFGLTTDRLKVEDFIV